MSAQRPRRVGSLRDPDPARCHCRFRRLGCGISSQLAPESPAFNELITIRKTGPLDVEALHRALTKVVARHEAWRTTLRTADGVPHQFVWEATEVDLPLTDLTDLAPEDAVHSSHRDRRRRHAASL